MKKNIMVIIMLSAAYILLTGCEKNIRDINCKYAMDNKHFVLFAVDKMEYVGKDIEINSAIYDVDSGKNSGNRTIVYTDRNNKKNSVTGSVLKILFPVYTPDTNIDYFVNLNGQIITVSGVAKKSEFPTLNLKSMKEYELVATDDSRIKGYITAINLETGAITIESTLNRWSFTPDKIKQLSVYTINVKLIFRDGSLRKGVLISDDGKFIIISTAGGNEKYDRANVLKIEYPDNNK